MGTYRILYAAADGVFTFIPVFLAYTAAKKFNANQFVSVGIAAALLYPDLTAAYSAGESLTFLKIPVVLVSYTSSVIPIIISVYVLSKLEKLLKKVVPDICKTFLTPLLSLLIMVPATYLVIGPIADTAGKLLASGYTGLVSLNPVIAGGLLGLIWPAAVMFGVHWGFVPIVMNNIAEYGRDTLFVITGPNNMAQAGAIVAAAGTGAPTLLGTSLLTLPGYIGVGFVGFLIACAIAYFGAAAVTYFFGYSDDMLPKKENDSDKKAAVSTIKKDEAIKTPVSGKAIPLSEVKDEAFSGGILGQGAAVIPDDGKICAPCDGTVTVMYPTGHAVGILSDGGAEILIHIGMDTVSLEGKHFDVRAAQGQKVKAGDVLVVADLDAIREEGLDVTTPVIVTNTEDYLEIRQAAAGKIERNETLLNCISK